ncbi:Ectopic P granules protein 5 [Rhizophlyctis rosea]|nr:Ectopic P granules protein 5 [Rhizophlyctis rosea]
MEAPLVKHRKLAKKKKQQQKQPTSPTDESFSVIDSSGTAEALAEPQTHGALSEKTEVNDTESVSNLDLLRPAVSTPSAPVYPSATAPSYDSSIATEAFSPIEFASNFDPSAPHFDIDTQYPSLDDGYVTSPFDQYDGLRQSDTVAPPVDDTVYPSAPQLTHEDVTSAISPSVRIVNDKTSLATTTTRRLSVIGQLALEDQTTLHPLDDTILAQLHHNVVLAEHVKVVEEFRNSANTVIAGDEFYEHVREYEAAFVQTQKAKLRVQAFQSETHNIVSRIWTLKKETQKVEASCGDGVRLTYTYTSETALYDEAVTELLKECLTKVRGQIYKDLTGNQFQAKLAKLWIQNYLDELLYQMPLLSQHVEPASPLQSPSLRPAILAKSTSEDDAGKLKHCLNVLFSFERKTNKAGSGTGEGTQADSGAVAVNASAFGRDVRGWITHLMSALLKVATLYDHRFILLHVLRCVGIGQWGASFVQWHPPSQWSDQWIDHYMTSLYAMLGPIEELEEVLQEKEAEIGHVKETLKKLEETDWVVVEDEDVGREPPARVSTFLGEEDYLSIMEQFNVVETFRYLLREQEFMPVDQNYPSPHSGSSDRQLLTIFAISNQILSTLSRGFQTFPKRGFARLKRKIGETIVACTKLLTESITANIGRWMYESYHSTGHFLHRPLLLEDRVGSTMAAEIDSFIYTSAQSLVETPRSGVWSLLVRLPVTRLTSGSKWQLLSGIVEGRVQKLRGATVAVKDLVVNMEKKIAGFNRALLSNQEEAGDMVNFIAELALSAVQVEQQEQMSQAPGAWQSHGSPKSLQLCIAVARAMFTATILNPELGGSVQEIAIKRLAAISETSSIIISCVLEWTREHFMEMAQTAGPLFEALPLPMWRPSARDMEVILSMLKDPIGSPKFRLGQRIVDRLDWASSNPQTRELSLPRSHHRLVALTLANICLDKQSLRDSRTGIISTTTSIASKGLATVGPYALPGSLSYLYEDQEQKFFEWCWSTILKLSLYHGPTGRDTYTLDHFATEERPFEHLSNPSLATLRGAMRSNAMAAYIVLMMSEIGHHYHMFKQEGWQLLKVISNDGRPYATLRAAVDLFPTFAKMYGIGCLEDEEFDKFFKEFFRTRFQVADRKVETDEKSSAKADDEISIIDFLKPLVPSQPSHSVDDLVLRFWLKALLADEQWHSNRTVLGFLNRISETSIVNGTFTIVENALRDEYVQLLNKHQVDAKTPISLQITHPLATTYSVASAGKNMLLQGYPTLVVGSSSWLEASAWVGAGAEKEKTWFAVAALLSETYAEDDVRRIVGEAMSKNPQSTIAKAVVGTEKPVAMFSIFRWAQQVLEMPVDHPLLPVASQVFFSLYFQKGGGGAAPLDACFGFRFFLERRDILDALERRLGQCSQTYAERMVGDMQGRWGSNVDQLSQLYNAMGLWLREPRLVSPDNFVDTLSDRYCVERLKQCMGGYVLRDFAAAWMDLVPTGYVWEALAKEARIIVPPAPFTPPRTPAESATMVQPSVVRPAPTFVSRQPLVQPLATFTVRLASTIFDQDLGVLLGKARSFDGFASEHEKLDEDYAANLSRLYANESKRGRAERGCGNKCTGRAVFDYRVQEVQLVGEVKSFLAENRAHAESLASTDHMDPKVCISALKVIRAMDWLCSGGGEEQDGGGRRKVATQVFYRTVATLGASAKEFPPAALVLDRLVRSLGITYIASSAEETEKMFGLMTTQEKVDLLVDVFNPAVATDAFGRMYSRVADMVGTIDDAAVARLIGRFDVHKWLDRKPRPSVEAQVALSETVVSKMADVGDGAILDAQRAIVRKLMALLPEEVYIGVVDFSFSRTLGSGIHPVIFKDIVHSLVSEETWRPTILETTELLNCRLSRDKSIGLAASITRILVSTCQNDVPLYTAAAAHLQTIIDLEIIIFASSAMYSISSDIHREEAWVALRELTLPFLGMIRQSSGFRVIASVQEHVAEAKQMMELFCGLMGKIRRHVTTVDSICAYFWDVYGLAVNQGCPEPVLVALQHVLRQQPWSGMQLGWEAIKQMLVWGDSGKLTVEMQRFICFVLMTSQWRLEYRGATETGPTLTGPHVMDAILLIFSLVSNAATIFNDAPSRQQFFDSMRSKCFDKSKWSHFTPVQYGEVVERLPEDWSPAEETSTLLTAETQNRASPMLFTLDCLRSMAGISADVKGLDSEDSESTYSKVEQYVDYVLGLLSTQTSVMKVELAPERCRTFSSEHVGDVLCEVMQLSELGTPTAQQARGVACRHIMQRCFALLNASERGSNTFNRLWEGLARGVRASSVPILIVSVACQTVASAEHMALLVEMCLERHLELTRDPQGWKYVMRHLAVPELEAETFIRHCLGHALVLTLYAHILQKLEECEGSPDLRVMIGEQLGNWIVRTKMEAAEEGTEGKMVLLFAQFADLLATELASLPLPERHSRLRSLLPEIADVLLKWAEDRANQGLWATLGFGPRSRLSVRFRMFARAVGTFVATRLLGTGQEDQKARLIATVTALQSNSEYQRVAGHVDAIVKFLEDEGNRLGALPQLVEMLGQMLFPEFHMMGMAV